MRLLGSHFVLGQTIEEALDARRARHRELRYSFDMLGEGARTAADAERYFDAYAARDRRHRRPPAASALPDRPGISVKLSALHPRFEAISRERVLARTGAAAARARAQGAGARAQFHRRCRGGGPARAYARRDRRRAAPIRRCAAGTASGSRCRPIRSARRAVIDWLEATARCARPPADGAAGQGRLLGHRDQARAGARARRLSGVHPQGDDRPLLHRLHAQAAGARGRGSIRNSPPTTRSRSRA